MIAQQYCHSQEAVIEKAFAKLGPGLVVAGCYKTRYIPKHDSCHKANESQASYFAEKI